MRPALHFRWKTACASLPAGRLAVACAALLLHPGAWSQPAPAAGEQVYDFDVSLDQRVIGSHRFIVNRQADGATGVQSTASFDVRLLGIAAYRYRHEARERWQDGCLLTLEATTRDNGRALRVAGTRIENRFELKAPSSRALPGCVAAYAYWDRDLLLRQKSLLNPQTGRLDPLRVESLGSTTLQRERGDVPAERFRLHAAQGVIDLWYSPRGEWLQLESAVGSRRLVYRLREPG